MKRLERWQLEIAGAMIAGALLLLGIRWFLFPGAIYHAEMERYLVDDLAFIFIQVLILSLVIDRVIRAREREAILEKLNMVIGAFYSEIGTRLMGVIASWDDGFDSIRQSVLVKPEWGDAEYAAAKKALRSYPYRVTAEECDLARLHAMLQEEKSFVLNLLTNQGLLEHEAFTELLWAVTHLAEELEVRPSLADIPPADLRHLAGDINRAYVLLVIEWFDYMRHLETNYPFLFALAVRTNPLDPDASPIVTE